MKLQPISNPSEQSIRMSVRFNNKKARTIAVPMHFSELQRIAWAFPPV